LSQKTQDSSGNLREGQILSGPLFDEPMRIETLRRENENIWVLGLVGMTSSRFRKVHLPDSDLASLTILDSVFTYDGDGKLLRLGLQAYSLGIAYEFDPYFGLSISRIDPLPHQLEAVRTGCRHVDPRAIRAFLKTLVYPISFLDFETFMTAIPLYDGVRPYQQVPFQFSLHIVSASATSATTRSSLTTESTGSPGAGPSHHSYLSDGRSDPSPKILELLTERLGDSGSIVCY
jgi:hypothetical protein